ncbi:hypothetical protein chiPu_0008668 [Chiloscyllium punctatum]|uniref:Uncharacterized protein n=1 Tax=Chiloscyllium punctatum TaxID=137246 RepID=A0A401SIQ5_CHIPU|nr:hypothetical protein [Chiloscyllium punctatum]
MTESRSFSRREIATSARAPRFLFRPVFLLNLNLGLVCKGLQCDERCRLGALTPLTVFEQGKAWVTENERRATVCLTNRNHTEKPREKSPRSLKRNRADGCLSARMKREDSVASNAMELGPEPLTFMSQLGVAALTVAPAVPLITD